MHRCASGLCPWSTSFSSFHITCHQSVRNQQPSVLLSICRWYPAVYRYKPGMLGLEAWPRPRGQKSWPRPRGSTPRPRGSTPRPRTFWPRLTISIPTFPIYVDSILGYWHHMHYIITITIAGIFMPWVLVIATITVKDEFKFIMFNISWLEFMNAPIKKNLTNTCTD